MKYHPLSIIRDAMAVLQMMPDDKHASFQQLANVYMETLLHCFRDADMLLMCLIDMTIKSL